MIVFVPEPSRDFAFPRPTCVLLQEVLRPSWYKTSRFDAHVSALSKTNRRLDDNTFKLGHSGGETWWNRNWMELAYCPHQASGIGILPTLQCTLKFHVRSRWYSTTQSWFWPLVARDIYSWSGRSGFHDLFLAHFRKWPKQIKFQKYDAVCFLFFRYCAIYFCSGVWPINAYTKSLVLEGDEQYPARAIDETCCTKESKCLGKQKDKDILSFVVANFLCTQARTRAQAEQTCNCSYLCSVLKDSSWATHTWLRHLPSGCVDFCGMSRYGAVNTAA